MKRKKIKIVKDKTAVLFTPFPRPKLFKTAEGKALGLPQKKVRKLSLKEAKPLALLKKKTDKLPEGIARFPNNLVGKKQDPYPVEYFNELFVQYSRVPEVAFNISKAKEVLEKYKITPPAWMFNLLDTKDLLSQEERELMSFLVDLSLYDRFLSQEEFSPNLLIGFSPVVYVATQVKTFEKTVIDIFCSVVSPPPSLRVYQINKQQYKASLPSYSLLHFLEKEQSVMKKIKEIIYKCAITRCVYISSFTPSHSIASYVQKSDFSPSCKMENFKTTDLYLKRIDEGTSLQY